MGRSPSNSSYLFRITEQHAINRCVREAIKVNADLIQQNSHGVKTARQGPVNGATSQWIMELRNLRLVEGPERGLPKGVRCYRYHEKDGR